MQETGKRQTRRERPICQKESNRWLQTARRVQLELGPYLDAGGRVTLLQDREADIFELLALPRHPNLDLIVRAAYPRTVEIVAEDLRCSLLPLWKRPLGWESTRCRSRPGRGSRSEWQSLRCG
jgi:hypothetical protein